MIVFALSRLCLAIQSVRGTEMVWTEWVLTEGFCLWEPESKTTACLRHTWFKDLAHGELWIIVQVQETCCWGNCGVCLQIQGIWINSLLMTFSWLSRKTGYEGEGTEADRFICAGDIEIYWYSLSLICILIFMVISESCQLEGLTRTYWRNILTEPGTRTASICNRYRASVVLLYMVRNLLLEEMQGIRAASQGRGKCLALR